jgi:serine/threonine-protein kinase
MLVLCCATNWMWLADVRSPGPYLVLWVLGLHIWAAIFWFLRSRGGPVTFVERQIVHAWAAGTIGTMVLFLVEMVLGLEVLTLAPILAVLAGAVFLIKAGTLSGVFYFAAAAFFLTAVVMAWLQPVALFLFGIVSAACFFIPGYRYHRQRRRSMSGESR